MIEIDQTASKDKPPSVVSGRLVHVGTRIDLTDLRDQIFLIRQACDRIERGEITQDFEFGRASNFIYAKGKIEREYSYWLSDARSEQESELRCTILRPVARAIEAVDKSTWRVWHCLPNHENDKSGDKRKLSSSLAGLRKVIGICMARLENLGS